MLRNRSRSVKSKQSLMADHTSQTSSPNQNPKRSTIPSLFGSPKFRAFTTKCLSGAESLRSPTSILDTISISPFGNPFSYDRNQPLSSKVASENKPPCWGKLESQGGIGLALIDTLNDGSIEKDSSTKPRNGKVLFGTQLRVQIPPPFPCGSSSNASSISNNPNGSPRIVAQSGSSVDLSEMELCEEYTCVICHGPNPKTTHIFDNCIVDGHFFLPHNNNSNYNSASQHFLSFCYTCKKNLEQTKDIFIYRGEKAFCSGECRYQEMVSDGMDDKSES